MLIRGDARVLPLRDSCVDCCITSPPYFGLRDYGTARWDGGDPACDHRSPTMRAERNEDRPMLAGSYATNAAQLLLAHRTGCGKCGATRIDAQIGLEPTPAEYVSALVGVFREVKRVLKPQGTVWLNLGDSYAGGGGFAPNAPSNTSEARAARGARDCIKGHKLGGIAVSDGLKPKDLIGIPWRVAFALQADGWWLRSDIVWNKPSCMPESVTDRPTRSHEYIFLLSKQASYWYDSDAIKETATCTPRPETSRSHQAIELVEHNQRRGSGGHVGGNLGVNNPDAGRNKRTVWTINPENYSGSHFATFPEALVEPCLLAGCPEGGLVLDPFCGTATVGAVAERFNRRWVGVDLAYQDLARERTAQRGLRFDEATA